MYVIHSTIFMYTGLQWIVLNINSEFHSTHMVMQRAYRKPLPRRHNPANGAFAEVSQSDSTLNNKSLNPKPCLDPKSM